MRLLERYKMDLIVDGREASKEAILSLVEVNEKADLLDLGSGDSRRLADSIAGRVRARTVTCVDLKGIPSTGRRNGRVYNYFPGDLNNPPFPVPGLFDIVIASQVIEHLWNTDGFIKEVYRVLRPGGYALISTPNLASWINVLYLLVGKQPEPAKVSEDMYPEHERPGHLRVFTLKELRKFLRFHGFKIEKVVGSGYPPFTGRVARLMSRSDPAGSSTVTVKVRRSQ